MRGRRAPLTRMQMNVVTLSGVLVCSAHLAFDIITRMRKSVCMTRVLVDETISVRALA